ncbi:MAG: YciI family protein [Gammaproteobacteria bacterium]|nr:YciI family protein [Gammaproteobacteria bacterium]MCP5423814.1 YciI family protein [Gammaproteobacteria bacterium]
MLYVIIGRDAPATLNKRMEARPAHLQRLQTLQEQGRVILAGPCPAIDSPDPGPAGFSGSVMVVEFPSLQEAQDWAQSDPYVAAGVFTSVEVLPFKKVLP